MQFVTLSINTNMEMHITLFLEQEDNQPVVVDAKHSDTAKHIFLSV